MADGTGVTLRKKHTSKTKGKKSRKSKSKTREVKMAVFFQGGSLWKGKYGKLAGDAIKEYKYFRRNKDRMKYDVYRKTAGSTAPAPWKADARQSSGRGSSSRA